MCKASARTATAKTLNVLNYIVSALQQASIVEIVLAKVVKILKKMNQRDNNSFQKYLNEIQKHFIQKKHLFKKLKRERKDALAERVAV